MEKIYTIKEMGEVLRMTRNNIYLLMKKGVLPTRTTVTGKKYFTEEDVKNYLNR